MLWDVSRPHHLQLKRAPTEHELWRRAAIGPRILEEPKFQIGVAHGKVQNIVPQNATEERNLNFSLRVKIAHQSAMPPLRWNREAPASKEELEGRPLGNTLE
jgi:hypothetical protein